MFVISVGKVTQKASDWLVFLVISCSIVTVGLLYLVQKAEAKGQDLSYKGVIYYSAASFE
jgi:hypothetical protein